jgi:NitT/TauT family transport system permease protein
VKTDKVIRYMLPTVAFVAAIGLWEATVRINQIPPVILPSPSLIATTLVKDWRTLFGSLEVTLGITLEALVPATAGGALLALIFAQWRPIEYAFFPFAVIM